MADVRRSNRKHRRVRNQYTSSSDKFGPSDSEESTSKYTNSNHMADTAKRNKRKHKRVRSQHTSSDESDRYSGESASNSEKNNFVIRKIKHVSKWKCHDLERLGINYGSEALSLSELKETVELHTKNLVDKPIPNFISSLEEYTRQTLKCSLTEKIPDFGSMKPELDKVYSLMTDVNHFIKNIREEKSELLKSDYTKTVLFETWCCRIRDFLNYYKRFLEDQFFLAKTESRFNNLFMAFSRIFFLDPELGNNEQKTFMYGEKIISFVPDTRFQLGLHQTLLVMLTGVKEAKLKKTNSEEFVLRDSLSNEDILARHGGELLAERDCSVLAPGVLGIICLETEIIFTYMDMPLDQYHCIKETGRSVDHSSTISYTRPYNFLLEGDRNEILSLLFWLGYVQTNCFKSLIV